MQRICLLAIVFLLAGAADSWAGRYHHERFGGLRHHTQKIVREYGPRVKNAHRFPVIPGLPGKPVHPIHPGDKPDYPGHRWPGYWWPATSTVVRETETIVIVQTPPQEAPQPAPEPEKVWVPPVMDTRTEPGYWDYGVKKMWMGDHWRFEQDFDEKTWVPESQVTYVKQAGYWKAAE